MTLLLRSLIKQDLFEILCFLLLSLLLLQNELLFELLLFVFLLLFLEKFFAHLTLVEIKLAADVAVKFSVF